MSDYSSWKKSYFQLYPALNSPLRINNTDIIDRIGLQTIRNIREELKNCMVNSDSYSTRIIVGYDFCNIIIESPTKEYSEYTRFNVAIDRVLRGYTEKLIGKSSIQFDFYVEIYFPKLETNDLYKVEKHTLFGKLANVSKPDFSHRDSLNYYDRDLSNFYLGASKACLVCGGGGTYTKYGRKNHTSGCRYTRRGRIQGTLKHTKGYKSNPLHRSRSGTIKVRGYYRKDGTYVKPHTRRRQK